MPVEKPEQNWYTEMAANNHEDCSHGHVCTQIMPFLAGSEDQWPKQPADDASGLGLWEMILEMISSEPFYISQCLFVGMCLARAGRTGEGYSFGHSTSETGKPFLVLLFIVHWLMVWIHFPRMKVICQLRSQSSHSSPGSDLLP